MTLIEVVRQVGELDRELVIFARRPWGPYSEVRLSKLAEGARLPGDIIHAGFDYFLEVFVALEALEVLDSRQATDKQRTTLLIYYAENDSFPDWAYQE